jgi:hypothetical protein
MIGRNGIHIQFMSTASEELTGIMISNWYLQKFRDRLSVTKRRKEKVLQQEICFMLSLGLNGDEVCFCEVGTESFEHDVDEIFALLLSEGRAETLPTN